MTQDISNKRATNFELLRILAMLMILASHYINSLPCESHTINEVNILFTVLSHFLGSFGKIGVCLFFLITGYFMCNSQIHLKSIMRIIINTLFYSWLFAIIFVIFVPSEISIIKIYKSILPIATEHYWFITTYIIVYLLLPILNIIINSIKKETFNLYIICFLIIWFIIPPFIYKGYYASNDLSLCIFVYFIGAYIKKYNMSFFYNKRNYFYLYIIPLLFIIGWLCICYSMDLYKMGWWRHITNQNSIFVLCISVSLFYLFKNAKINYNKYINTLASACLGVYLITSNIWISKIWWIKFFHCCDSKSTLFLVWNLFFAIIFSYLICFSIDKIKDFLFLNYFFKYITNSKLFISIENKISLLLK